MVMYKLLLFAASIALFLLKKCQNWVKALFCAKDVLFMVFFYSLICILIEIAFAAQEGFLIFC
ncbi:MAG: hypothetical protein DI631_01725 [Acinetobacter johnsonii]|nr:MAG: hypothetical protein DI631_01725 [Acinetobacter johnsonii]